YNGLGKERIMNDFDRRFEESRLERIEDEIGGSGVGTVTEGVQFAKASLDDKFDARTWVKEWIKTIRKTPSIPTDEGTMIGWFANAIMAGYDYAYRQMELNKKVVSRRFLLERIEDETGVSGVGTVAEGVQFASGVCVISWLTEVKSIAAIYANIETVKKLHGHEGKTIIKWIDQIQV
ncbi:MAG: hypothetical protein KAR42_17940, partial [candidate division Zixibacteria bacterium]|nr:hypothetical protein [candidate division Zixibacteria bacterium]